MLNKNCCIELDITDVTNDGRGVGHFEEIAVFVPRCVSGDRVKVKIIKVLSHYCIGRIEQIVIPGKARKAAECPLFGRCGGCSLQHMQYEETLRIKEKWVKDSLERIGGLKEIEYLPVIPSPQIWRYRNKAQYPVREVDGKAVYGFFAVRSHRIVECGDCLLQPKEFSDIADTVIDYINDKGIKAYCEETGKGTVRHIFLRKSETTGEIVLCLVINTMKFSDEQQFKEMIHQRFPQISSVIINYNSRRDNVILSDDYRFLWGDGLITDKISDIELEISPASFYQVNRAASELLYAKAREFADVSPDDTVLDIYCGIGSVGLCASCRDNHLIGVENISAAVENARINAIKNNFRKASFICADAQEAAVKLNEESISPNIILFDPPRAGCTATTLEAAASMSPEKMVMISCNPATMARDCKILFQLGYKPVKAVPVDMFPWTSHIESVVLLSRSGSTK